MTYTFEMDTDIMDDLLHQPKQCREQQVQTRHNGRVKIISIIQEKLETPRDKQFKFNPSMRING